MMDNLMSAPIDFMEAARSEERRLLAELEATQKRLEAVRARLNAYSSSIRNQSNTNSAWKHQSRRSILITSVTNYLREKGARATSGELVAALISRKELASVLASRGFDLGGKNAAWKLASVLSSSADLDNIRGEGYGLKKWSNGQSP